MTRRGTPRLPPPLRTWRFVWNNLWSRPLRTCLTGLVLALCTLSVLVTSTIFDLLDRVATAPATLSTLVVQPARGIGEMMPAGHPGEVRGVPGVQVAHGMRALYGAGRDERHEFLCLWIDPGGLGTLLDATGSAVGAGDLDAFASDVAGVLVGRVVAEENGWTTGDTVHITLFPGPGRPAVMRVRGTIEAGLLANGIVGPLDFLRTMDYGPGVNFVLARGTSGNERDLALRIDERLRNSQLPTRTESAAGMLQRFEDATALRPLILGGSLVAVASTLLIAATSLALALRERADLVPVLKALGFPARWVTFALLAEPISLALGSTVFGTLLFGAIAVQGVVIDIGVASLFHLRWWSALLAFAITGGAAALAIALPLRALLGAPVVDGLGSAR